MKYLPILCLILLSATVLAQNASLPLDERGKYIYYEVVTPSHSKDSLIARAKFYIKANKIKMDPSQTDTVFSGESKFELSKTASKLSHPSGEILYKITIEVSDKKYRFWFTDFRFIPYQRDRYGNFVATTVFATPLEKTPSKLNKNEWSSYVENTTKQAKQLGEELKTFMAAKQPEKTAEKRINTKTW